MFSDTEKGNGCQPQYKLLWLSSLSFHPFCVARLAALLEGVLYCCRSSWAAILALPVHLAALLELVN
jgi:hypothetical protein